ncbi:hypothetical protein BH24ACT10_BH24ACT10_18660 [soil metagenome]
MSGPLGSRRLRVVAACLVHLMLVGVAVAPQLSARLTGEELRLAVAPLDPIDPFRGAYVVLGYPDLPQQQQTGRRRPLMGTVFIPLKTAGDLWEGSALTTREPSAGPYLRCDTDGWQVRCGIESLFAAQDEALRIEQQLATGAVAVVRVDDDGNAAVVRVEAARP